MRFEGKGWLLQTSALGSEGLPSLPPRNMNVACGLQRMFNLRA